MEPYFDEEIGMWMYDEQPETQEDKWAAEAEVMDVESRAQQVAMEVADEVALLEQQLGYTTTATTDWVQWGNSLLDEIGMYQPTLPNSAYAGLGVHADRYPKLHCRRRHKDPTPDLTCAPWGILLSTDLPLGCHFHPRDQVRLRGVCYALRGEKSTSDHLTQILDHLGIRVRLGQPEQLFHLTCRVFDELTFVQRTREVVAQAIGLRSDDPGTANLCHVSGSYALNRLMLVGDRPNSGSGGSRDCGDHNSILSEGPKRTIIRGLADGRQRRAAAPRSCPSAQGGDVPTAATGISWTPGDIDIFVGCHGAASTKKSVASFSALVEHAKASCHLIYRNARVRHSFRMLSAVFGTEFRDPTVGVPVEPTVKVSSEYEGWGGHIPAGVEAAMSTRGQSYHRDVVLASMWSGRYASMWSSELRDTITHLQPTLGIRRPIRVERVAEVRPFKPRYDYLYDGSHGGHSRLQGVSYGDLWPMPLKINIIQYSHASARPIPSADLVAAFDLMTSMVTMKVDRCLTTHFEASEATRRCIAERELKLSKYAFGPSVDGTRSRIEDAIGKQLARIQKYKAYGFELRPPKKGK